MAFSNPENPVKRLEPPSSLPGIEPGDWIEIRTIYTAGMRREVTRRGLKLHNGSVDDTMDIFAYREALIEQIVAAWSDPEPVTPETLATLHSDVQDWLSREFDQLQNGRSPEEKKDYEPLSPLAGEPTTSHSLENSPT